MLDQKTLKELISYDPDTGVFTWLKRPRHHCKSDVSCAIFNSRSAGKKAGGICKGDGYVVIRVFSAHYKSHRLAFLYMTGSFPPEQCDHINGIRDDNRWANLRPVSHAENGRNQRIPSNNTSGVRGVCWHKETKKWRATIRVDDKFKYLGVFSEKSDAIAVRKAAEKKYGFHPNHGRTA